MASGHLSFFSSLNMSLKEKKNQCNLLAKAHPASADEGFIPSLLSCICSKTPSNLNNAFFFPLVPFGKRLVAHKARITVSSF